MITNPWVSVVGAYLYKNEILTQIELPTKPSVEYEDIIAEDYPVLSTETLIYNLMAECGNLELLFTDMDFLEKAIHYWNEQRLPVWQRLYNTLCVKYSPIWNNERWQTTTGTGSATGNSTKNASGTSENATAYSEKRTTETASASSSSETTSGSATDKVAGFNSETFVNKDTRSTSGTDNISSSGSIDETRNTTADTTDSGKTASTQTGTTSAETSTLEEVYERGKIGLTYIQDMLQKERDIAVFDLYDYIINDFKQKFCLMVY